MRIVYNRNEKNEPVTTAVFLQEGPRVYVGVAYTNPKDGTPNKAVGRNLAIDRAEYLKENQDKVDVCLNAISVYGVLKPISFAFNTNIQDTVKAATELVDGNIKRVLTSYLKDNDGNN